MADLKKQGATTSSDEVIMEVVFKVYRFSPDIKQPPRMQGYRIPVRRGMTILDGLHHIRDNLDSTLSYRFSCRMAACGSCGMYINGLPRLACETQILELNSERIEVSAMPNFEVSKDLIPKLTDLFDKHRSVMPYIQRDEDELEQPTNEFLQSPEELESFLQFAYCIKCGLCLSACPTVATDPDFIGPQALVQAFRYNADTRDKGLKVRIDAVGGPEGPWRCHFSGACSEACPKGVDPAFGVQLLKGQIVFNNLKLRKPHKPAQVAPRETGAKCRSKIPEAPPPTVEK